MEQQDEQVTFRDSLIDKLRRELFGPVAEDGDTALEEELLQSPLFIYGTGVLFPQKIRHAQLEDSMDDKNGGEGSVMDGLEDAEDVLNTNENESQDLSKGGVTGAFDDSPEEQPLNLANEYSPSAMGITFRVRDCDELKVVVEVGIYGKNSRTVPHRRAGEKKVDGTKYPDTRAEEYFKRKQIHSELKVSLQAALGPIQKIVVPDTNSKLTLQVTNRILSQGNVISFMLVNMNENPVGGFPDFQDAFFQVQLTASDFQGRSVFRRIDRSSGNVDVEELASLNLLYRHRQSFALGHGCAGDWYRDSDVERTASTSSVYLSTLPSYEIKPIRPRELPYKGNELNLSMHFLAHGQEGSEEEDKKSIITGLNTLCDDYGYWINDQANEIDNLDSAHQATAKKHIEACGVCLDRAREGIRTISEDRDIYKAFRLANKAMLMQQYHADLSSRNLDSDCPKVPTDYKALPNGKGYWRPFQLAFILMNIASASDKEHPHRKLVDLIWFPTGGGKTEAYLGLAAFVIALRRIRRQDDHGTSVIMRYTLRLLTSQQFERASTLILALELLRQEKAFGVDMGDQPISIGLWVGKSLSPNKRDVAVAAHKKMAKGEYVANPFQLLECPWCKVEFNKKGHLGYVRERRNGGEQSIYFQCPDDACRWSGAGTNIPISVIDQDIYDQPPSLLLGTVDKFAQVAWRDEVGRLFGMGIEASPPELIIQDELHLISGPLGTIVGMYESAIERLCSRDGHTPKIVASTATIRRAKEQCKALYNRETFEFPPAGLKAGDSYFAYEDVNSPGRVYVGVFGSALKSHATAQVRCCSALLQGVNVPGITNVKDKEYLADPYGTLVWYFNSLRELGHALTLCTGDIPEHIYAMCKRAGIPQELKRRIRTWSIIELTSRRTEDEIPNILKTLKFPWKINPEKNKIGRAHV